ncbi:MAG: M14 metallopeptidase family protein [Spirosomataceae bacterium]
MHQYLRALVLGLFLSYQCGYAQNIPSPKEHFGFNIGDDYHLSNYTQTEAYFRKLAASDRVKLVDIGLTEEGRHQLMLVVTSPENHKKLDRYKQISQQLARAEGLTDEQARALAAEGKAIVWIDGGIHSNETVGTMQLIETAWQLTSRKDPETMRILNDVVILLTHINPDGHELVGNWYMREPKPEKRSLNNLPKLYEKYAGHDNNRDYFMLHLKETQNVARQLFVDWIPQIMYNHHQAGPPGSIVAGPPYRDPFNYVFDPLMVTGIDALGAAMVNRLNAENKPGFTRLSGSVFSTWYNGGLRTTTHFHNMIGLLTEIIGNPTPMEVPLVPNRLIPNGATPFPVTPQKWYFKQSIDYSVSLNYATLNYAARYRDDVLFNIYRMGKNSIERGSKDYWTLSPKRIDAINQAYQADQKKTPTPSAVTAANNPTASESRPTASSQTSPTGQAGTTPTDTTRRGGNAGNRTAANRPGQRSDSTATASQSTDYDTPRGGNIPLKYYDAVMKDPALRDPRGFILPANQADMASVIEFLNALIRTGIQVQQATASFSVNGKTYPAGSYVVKTDQSFRPHVLDMFEPQDHPNDFAYPGGPPIRPYDAAGWTLAYQMGVQVDRVLDGFDGPFKKLAYGELIPLKNSAPAVPSTTAAGYVLSAKVNNSFAVVNDLLQAGLEVFRLPSGITGMSSVEAGAFYVPHSAKAKTTLEKSAADFGVPVSTVAKRPTSTLTKVSPLRIALWDTYGGSMPSGWTRWILEQYHYPYNVVFSQDIDAGDLNKKYDAIIFVTRAIPAPSTGAATGAGGGEGGFTFREPKPEEIPAEYRATLGRITADKSIPKLKEFLENGGNVITIGSSTNLAYHLGLPVKNALVEMTNTGQERPLAAEKYYIPGSILQVSLDSTQHATYGLSNKTDVYFDASPVFKIAPDAIAKGTVKPLAWFSTAKPLRSGWAWGQAYLQDGVAAFVAPVGSGKLYAIGPEVTFRSQAQGTFKFLFNQLYSLK